MSGIDATDFASTARSLLNDSTFSDAVIVCGDKKHDVHRCIIATHSAYFKKLLSDKLKGTDHRLELDAGDAQAFGRVLNYFYGFTYDDDAGSDEDFKNSLEVNAAVYALAEKYECADLKRLAVKKFGRAAKDMIVDREALETIRIVYETTPSADRGLRDICVTLWAVAGAQMVGENERAAFQEFVEEVPGFAVDIAMRFASTMSKAQIVESCTCHQNVYTSSGQKRDLKEAMEHKYAKSSITVSQTSKLDVFWS